MVGVGIDRVMMIIIINKGKIGRVPKKIEKQSNAWAVH